MRYIGNKTKLLDFIRRVLRQRGITAGVAVDPFCGTASVARELKRLGFQVRASDIMEYAHVLARAYVETVAEPDLSGAARALGAHAADARSVVRELNRVPAQPGFVTRHFSAPLLGAAHGRRMYFTTENAARIDAIRGLLHEWHGAHTIDDAGYFTLLAALIEASDRVANTTGVYAAYVKSWQPNARRPLELKAARIVRGNGCHARRQDALAAVRELDPFELLYLDPPYNARQYAGYYHVPELIALGWFDALPVLRGKTGLLPDRDKRTDWSRQSRCEHALEAVLAGARCRHIVMSYNAEGIIPEPTIERLLKQYGRRETYQKYRRRYRRYRSDADGEKRKYAG
ncbi:MAG TPA: DNA adenine methylase, partial [Longimicrobiales bacterium]